MVSHTSCVYLDYQDFMQNDFITGATRQRRLRRGCPGFGHAPPDMPGGWPRPSRSVMGLVPPPICPGIGPAPLDVSGL